MFKTSAPWCPSHRCLQNNGFASELASSICDCSHARKIMHAFLHELAASTLTEMIRKPSVAISGQMASKAVVPSSYAAAIVVPCSSCKT